MDTLPELPEARVPEPAPDFAALDQALDTARDAMADLLVHVKMLDQYLQRIRPSLDPALAEQRNRLVGMFRGGGFTSHQARQALGLTSLTTVKLHRLLKSLRFEPRYTQKCLEQDRAGHTLWFDAQPMAERA
ncbi:MAG: hypothetical protein CMN73_04200 [Sphingomonas sp.]|nr:hypothetical protein [Sphingomonas sp.]